MRAICVFSILLLAGCGTAPMDVGGLEKPAAVLMTKPQPLPEQVVGEDIAVNNLDVRRVCAVEISKLKRLQRWAYTVTKGK